MKASHFSKDILEFLSLLEKYEIKYLIVGGEAVIYYGYARLTGDVDFFYETSIENVTNLFEALYEFWQGDIPGIGAQSELMEPGIIIQFGMPPNRIDLLNRIDRVTFQKAWSNRTTTHIQTHGHRISVHFIGLGELIKNKEALRRHKDLDDLKYLKKAKKENRPP